MLELLHFNICITMHLSAESTEITRVFGEIFQKLLIKTTFNVKIKLCSVNGSTKNRNLENRIKLSYGNRSLFRPPFAG